MQRSTTGPGPAPTTILLLVGLLLAGCGDGGATTSGGGGGAGTVPTDAPVATDAPAPTDAPAATDAGTGGGGGGGGGGDVCGLVSVEEMEGLFGVSGVTQGFFAGPPDTCDYQLDSAPFVAMVLSPFAASQVFDAMAADSASQTIGGIGDRALYNAQTLSFLLQKGESLLTLQVLDESRSEEERLELMKQIAAIAAGRM